jgi:hypothetical protein
VFPLLFPVCTRSWLNEFFAFPMFWISSAIHMDAVVSLRNIFNNQEHWEH